jgi:NAD(P)H-hydrate epimerase
MTAPARTLNREQSRRLDQRAMEEYGIPGLVLMENAGRGVADRLALLGITGPVAICCGKGNNGGDGFVIARHLDLSGYAVRVLLCGDPAELQGDAAVNFRIIQRSGLPIAFFGPRHDAARWEEALAGTSWIVDALLGTGSHGEPRPPLDAVIDQINASAATKLAVDLSSGLDCDTGLPASHTIRARHTCTFAAMKPGFLVPGAELYTGQVHVVQIGVPRRLMEEMYSSRSA